MAESVIRASEHVNEISSIIIITLLLQASTMTL